MPRGAATSAPVSLISQLEAAVHTSSSEKRVDALRRISDLFLANAERVSDTQVALFGDVLSHLAAAVENRALAELSTKLAAVDNAPRALIRQLARNDDIAVAGAVLALSNQLIDDDLVEIAETKTQGHLLAISGRAVLGERVTDVLVERGDREVVHRVASNAGASFSKAGFMKLVKRAEDDGVLAERVGTRLDLPAPLLHELLRRATEDVRARILQAAPAESRKDVQQVLAAVSNEIVGEVIKPKDYARAQQLVLLLKQRNSLNDAALMEFANAGRYEEVVASLSLMCSAPIRMIEGLMRGVGHDGLVVACKAAGLKWPATVAILSNRFAHHAMSDAEMQNAKADFIKFSVSTAQRVLRFWLIRKSAAT